jgi:diguanylate cyclase (GGDEF)-like protein/PAS domain S-box-containing protein
MPSPTTLTDSDSDHPPGSSSSLPRALPVWPGAASSAVVALLVGVVAAIYFAAAKLGLSMASTHKSVSLVWPPTGISLAALLLFGYRLWPGIALGAFLVNASSGVSLAVAAGISAGNTLEALAGTYLLRRLTRFQESLERPQDVLGFVALAAGLGTTASATIGIASLCLGGAAAWHLYGQLWWQWWLGDAMGALVIAPVLLTWATRRQITWTLPRVAEAGALFALLAAISESVFNGWFAVGTIKSPLAFAIFPFLIWAALRFSQREAATATLLASAIATWHTARQVGPFASETITESFIILQIFMSVVAVTALVMGAALGGRRRVEAALQQSERRYRELFENATTVVYTADLDGRFTSLNKLGEEICGYALAEVLGMSLADLATPACAEMARRMIARQATEDVAIVYELEIIAKSGRRVALEVSTRLVIEDGRPIGVQGVARDVTQRRQAEAALEQANHQLTEWVRELEARTGQTTLLSEMGDLLQSCLTAEEAYAVIGAFTPKLFPSESGALGVLGSSKNLVEVVTVWGDSPPCDQVFAPDRCWALRRGRVYHVDAPGSRLVCAHLDPSLPTGYLCVPMMAHGEPLGILHLQGASSQPDQPDRAPEPLRESRRRLAVTVAEHIGLALANLRLRDTLRSQSILDPLTGLFNRRYLEETLELELARATRGHRAIGIIMLDLDHFKPLNDSCGHDAGDELLRELAGLLKSRVRDGDIACRYGGEEFVLILPEAPMELAQRRAEELREEVKRLRVSHRGRVIGPITASAGVAAFPDHGRTRSALLHAADAALYQAKAEGRDRVILAS